MKPAVDFRARAEELKMLAYVRPRPQDRKIVMESLGCKWEGSQSLAAQTLGCWGDRESVEALREFWIENQVDRREWTFMWTVARALALCVKEHWVLDLYFEAKDSKQEVFAGVVKALVVERVKQRLLKESRSPDPVRRMAALHVLGRMAFMAFPDRLALLKRFLGDEDGKIAGVARLLNYPFLPGEEEDDSVRPSKFSR